MSGDKLDELLGPAGSLDNIKIGERLFTLVNYAAISSLNEHYVMKLMRETGLDTVLPKHEGEADLEYLVRLQAALIDSLKTHELLAGFLLPVGKSEADWDLAVAAHTTRYLKAQQDPDARAEIQRLALNMVFVFFKAGLDSYNASLKSLESGDRAGPKKKRRKRTGAG